MLVIFGEMSKSLRTTGEACQRMAAVEKDRFNYFI